MRQDGMQISGTNFAATNTSSPIGGGGKSSAERASDDLKEFFTQAWEAGKSLVNSQTNNQQDSTSVASFNA